MNTQQIRDEIRDSLWEWAEFDDGEEGWRHRATGEVSFAQNPIPDTLDAAVGVIEGAGYELVLWHIGEDGDTTWYAQADHNEHGVIQSQVPYRPGTTSRERRDECIWQLALACVKATVTNDNNPPAISQNGGE